MAQSAAIIWCSSWRCIELCILSLAVALFLDLTWFAPKLPLTGFLGSHLFVFCGKNESYPTCLKVGISLYFADLYPMVNCGTVQFASSHNHWWSTDLMIWQDPASDTLETDRWCDDYSRCNDYSICNNSVWVSLLNWTAVHRLVSCSDRSSLHCIALYCIRS